jgi:molybdopterin converting factor subunit 1
MQIHVKLFALLREAAGTDSIALDLPEGASAAQALTHVQQQHPVLAPYLENVRLALRMDFVDAEVSLSDGDELHLIPPVSGGI